jgi:hypothetical protein
VSAGVAQVAQTTGGARQPGLLLFNGELCFLAGYRKEEKLERADQHCGLLLGSQTDRLVFVQYERADLDTTGC